MYCPFCGTDAAGTDKFCQSCGNNLKAEAKTIEKGTKSFPESSGEPIQYQPMEFKVQQKFFAFRDTYKVSDVNEQEFMVVRKEFFAFFRPRLFVENMNKEPIGSIQSNFWRTRWEIRDNEGMIHAIVHFPMFMFFRKRFDLETAEGWYNSGSSIFGYKFDAYDSSGQISFLVDKKILSIRDSFKIKSFGQLSPFITCLTAVTIDQRFHDKGGSGDSPLGF